MEVQSLILRHCADQWEPMSMGNRTTRAFALALIGRARGPRVTVRPVRRDALVSAGEGPIAKCFGDVGLGHLFALIEVGDCTCNLENAVISAGRKRERTRG